MIQYKRKPRAIVRNELRAQSMIGGGGDDDKRKQKSNNQADLDLSEVKQVEK